MNNKGDGIQRTKASINIDDDCDEETVKNAIQYAKDFKKHDSEIKDAIVKEYFANEQTVPWLYQGDNDTAMGQKVNGMSFEQKKKYFKDHLGTFGHVDKTEKAFSTGYKTINVYGDNNAMVYYDDGGAFYGHVFEVKLDLKSGRIHGISMGG